MAHGITHFFPGGTREQYEASIAAVLPHALRSRHLPQASLWLAFASTTDAVRANMWKYWTSYSLTRLMATT
jgi:hypothetical protein